MRLDIYIHSVPCASEDGAVVQMLAEILERIDKMATLDEVKAAVAAEAQQVKEAVDALEAQVQALKDQIAAGTAATPEQLDEVLASIQNIFTPK